MSKTAAVESVLPERDIECDHYKHPLELVPYFRRFKNGVLRNLVYTLIWNTAFALAFTMFALVLNPEWKVGRTLWTTFVIANCIGYLIHAGVELTERGFRSWIIRQSGPVRTLWYCGISVVGVFAGYWLGLALLNWRDGRQWVFSGQGAISVLMLSVLISGILATIFLLRERQARAEAAFARERARVEATEHQFHLAQLKLLEAQILRP